MRNPSFLVLAVLLLSVQSVWSAGEIDPSVRCSLQKQAATLQAFKCLTRARIAAIKGGAFDPAPCSARLTTKFQKEESKGTCPMTGDAPIAFQEVIDAEALLASTLDGDPEIVGRIKDTVRFVRCAASLVARVIRFGPHWARVSALEACYNIWEPVETGSLGDAYAYLAHADLTGVGHMAGMVGGNLSGSDVSGNHIHVAAAVDFTNATMTGTVLSGSDLTLADLSGADLSFASLLAAELTGADLSGVTWSSTICPDASNSDANGGSCCGHHIGDPPASCSP